MPTMRSPRAAAAMGVQLVKAPWGTGMVMSMRLGFGFQPPLGARLGLLPPP